MQVCMLPARVTCNGCVIVTCGDVVLICTILGAGVFSIECLDFWVAGLVFSLNAWGEMWLWIYRNLNGKQS